MGRRDYEPEVVYVDRGGDSSVKWLFWGALLGAGVALLYAPRSGDETRRSLRRRMRKLRAMTEEKIDELAEQLKGKAAPVERFVDEMLDGEGDEDDDAEFAGAPADPVPVAEPSVRAAMEARLADARARRRASGEPNR
jgi:hypothetical protein